MIICYSAYKRCTHSLVRLTNSSDRSSIAIRHFGKSVVTNEPSLPTGLALQIDFYGVSITLMQSALPTLVLYCPVHAVP